MPRCIFRCWACGLALIGSNAVYAVMQPPQQTLTRPSSTITAVANTHAEISAHFAVGEYNLRDYCDAGCDTAAQQTVAFHRVEARINAGQGGSLYVPAGSWRYDGRISGPMIFSTYGASIKGAGVGTTTVTVFGGAFATWTVAPNRPNGGHGGMADIRLYEADNPSSGAQVLLDRVAGFDLSNVWFGGGFVSLDLASAVGVHGTNVTIQGDNTTPGSILMRVHRANERAGHSSENTFANLNLRGAGGRTVTNSLVVNDSDGLWLTAGHIGFCIAEALLLKPEYPRDAIYNLHSVGVDYDTAGYGIHFAPLVGWTGEIGNNHFIGGLAELMDFDGFRVDNPGVVGLVLESFSTLRDGGYGINIAAGRHITINGGDHAGNNQNNAGASHIRIGGNAAFVSVSGVSYRNWHTPNVNNLQISDAADFISVGPSVYSGASAADVQVTSSGNHIKFSPGVTDRPADQEQGARGMEGQRATYDVRSTDPTWADISSGQCATWYNTADRSMKYYCNVNGTLRSTTLK